MIRKCYVVFVATDFTLKKCFQLSKEERFAGGKCREIFKSENGFRTEK